MGVAALFCLVLSVVLVLLAADVVRWRNAMQAGDVRYGASTEETRLWQAEPLLPFDPALGLGIDDDVDLREAVRSLRVARLEDPVISDPESPVRRNEAQARLEALVANTDDATRSRAASLLEALAACFVYETVRRCCRAQSPISLALDFDPTNDEPKYNLEPRTSAAGGSS